MTEKQMDGMSQEQIGDFYKKHNKFDESKSLEEYTIDIRDLIYLNRYVDEHCKYYDMDLANRLVKCNVGSIARFYEEKEPAAYAAIDVEYCGG